MKKIIAIILISFVTTCVFAKTNVIKPTLLGNQEKIAWEFGADDGMIFLLGKESDHSLLIQVNPFLANGRTPDAVTVQCNGKINHIAPSESLTCYGHFSDVIHMYIDPQDFTNGSAGAYSFIPLNK